MGECGHHLLRALLGRIFALSLIRPVRSNYSGRRNSLNPPPPPPPFRSFARPRFFSPFRPRSSCRLMIIVNPPLLSLFRTHSASRKISRSRFYMIIISVLNSARPEGLMSGRRGGVGIETATRRWMSLTNYSCARQMVAYAASTLMNT